MQKTVLGAPDKTHRDVLLEVGVKTTLRKAYWAQTEFKNYMQIC